MTEAKTIKTRIPYLTDEEFKRLDNHQKRKREKNVISIILFSCRQDIIRMHTFFKTNLVRTFVLREEKLK